MRDNILNKLQLFSKSMIGPVLFLPIVGLLIALMSVLSNKSWIEPESYVYIFGKYIASMMWVIMNNLSFFFCLGIASGMAKTRKADAVFVAALSYFMYLASNNAWLQVTDLLVEGKNNSSLYGTGQVVVLGFQVIDMGVFLGIILGIIIASVHNKFINKEFKGAFSIYGNSKFVLIVMIPIVACFSIFITYFWPIVALGISSLISLMESIGAAGVFIYGFLNRFLIPTGLHHLIWSPFVYTSIGGQMLIDGQIVIGAKPIFLAEMADATITTLDSSARFLTFGMVKIFGVAGVAYAFYKTALPENKQKLKVILLPVVLVSLLVGITEPFEFLFIFCAPLLWVIYSLIDGTFQMLADIFNVRVCATNGIIDFLIYNIPTGVGRTNWPVFVLLGVTETSVMYFVSKFIILKMKLRTPGREENTDSSEMIEDKPLVTTEEKALIGRMIVSALGGESNIILVENCFSRLRVDIKDDSLIDESKLKDTGAAGIVKKSNHIQIVYGMKINEIRNLVDQELGKLE